MRGEGPEQDELRPKPDGKDDVPGGEDGNES